MKKTSERTFVNGGKIRKTTTKPLRPSTPKRILKRVIRWALKNFQYLHS